MAITDKIYVKNHRQLASQLDVSIPRSAFAGATMDHLFLGESLDALDPVTRDRVIDFAADFLDCDCEHNPYCGHPERKFIRYLFDLRAEGLPPGRMVDVMTDDYMVYAYPGDVRSFLDDSVRRLEAIEDLASVEHAQDMERRARERRADLV